MIYIPHLECIIDIHCIINPSEDPQKVEASILNILEHVDIKINISSLCATTTKLTSLSKIYRHIQSHKTQKTYRITLLQNLYDYSTWFYLNKQAAFVKHISLCNDEYESPLGPIKIKITSKQIDKIILWLTC